MIELIDKQLDIIESTNKWIGETEAMQGAKGENAYRNFVNYRRKLNKKKFALTDNPAAALYGESQVGKSYLAGSLLSEEGKPFSVIDGDGNSYDFINKINPIGKGMESTSLITRFSIDYNWVNSDFPVKAKLLSIADLILVLCDSYYNDIKAQVDTALRSENINEEVKNILGSLKNSRSKQTLLREDDILDIQDYFYSKFSTKAANVIQSDFFDDISLIIEKTESSAWSNFFSMLWNKNPYFTELFSQLLKYFKKLDFVDEVYLPIDAVLRDNGTLLDVMRLQEIYGEYKGSEPNYSSVTRVLIDRYGKEEVITGFSKSYLCAMTAELVFRLPEKLQENKPFLENTDLLDFPGARGRLGIREKEIDDDVIPQLLLRGKVAYLFNKYSSSEKINILLFCHADHMSAQSMMPETLNNWIGDMIGQTSKDREMFIERSKVSPLFVVSTMFNKDLEHDFNNDREDNQTALNNRWIKRFLRILKTEIFGSDTYNWLKDWTDSQPNFQNIFLLRDFYHSSETNSKIFEGYNNSKKEIKEIVPSNYPSFRNDLRQSFIDFDFTKEHFKTPSISWDRAASINEDGSKLIIENLTIAAENINKAREEKLSRELNKIKENILEELKKYYHDSDSDARLQKAKSKAGTIQADLDIAFGQDPYFFGMMMLEFMLDESDVYSLFHAELNDIEKREIVNMDKYSGIRMNVPGLNPSDSFEANLERLRTQYEHTSVETCKEYFETQGIDLQELFYGNNERVKQFSKVLAEALEDFWFNQHMKNNQKISQIFTETAIEDIQEMLKALFDKLEITSKIMHGITKYVDGNRHIESTYGMVSDISTEIVNKFINTVGFEFYDESDFSDLKIANKRNSLGLVLAHDELQFEQNTPEEAAALITSMGNLTTLLNQNPLPLEARKLPNYRNYIMWYDRLKAGFVSVCDIPNYDVQANSRLKKIIDQHRAD